MMQNVVAVAKFCFHLLCTPGLDKASDHVRQATGRRPDGSKFLMELSLSKGTYDSVFYVAVIRDISQRLEAERLLKVRGGIARAGPDTRFTASKQHCSKFTVFEFLEYSLKSGR